MDVSMRLESETGVVVATCTGDMTIHEARLGVSELWGHSEWAGRPVVWDLRSAQLDFNTPEVREIAQFVLQNQPSTPPPRVAFVTAREVDFGMARMFEGFRENAATRIHVFRDLDEALSWASASDASGA